MAGATSALYEPLIERDLAAIPAAMQAFRAEHSSEETWIAIARFAVLAYAPSQHGKHALLACLAAHEFREESGFDDLVIECAKYVAASRQPWSEPPILTPPVVEESLTIDDLRAAVADGDRLAGERWLARNLDNVDDLLTVAADTFDDLGQRVIVARAALRLADLLGEKGRYAALRVAVWEMTASRGDAYVERGDALPEEELLRRIVSAMAEEGGSVESAHRLFLFEAAGESARVRDYLTAQCRTSSPACAAAERRPAAADKLESLSYMLARDYAEVLETHAAAKRLVPRFPSIDFSPAIAAAHENLRNVNFSEWSFA